MLDRLTPSFRHLDERHTQVDPRFRAVGLNFQGGFEMRDRIRVPSLDVHQHRTQVVVRAKMTGLIRRALS